MVYILPITHSLALLLALCVLSVTRDPVQKRFKDPTEESTHMIPSKPGLTL